MIICLFYEFCFASLETKCFQLTIILDGQVSGILASDGSFADLSIVPYEINLVVSTCFDTLNFACRPFFR